MAIVAAPPSAHHNKNVFINISNSHLNQFKISQKPWRLLQSFFIVTWIEGQFIVLTGIYCDYLNLFEDSQCFLSLWKYLESKNSSKSPTKEIWIKKLNSPNYWYSFLLYWNGLFCSHTYYAEQQQSTQAREKGHEFFTRKHNNVFNFILLTRAFHFKHILCLLKLNYEIDL